MQQRTIELQNKNAELERSNANLEEFAHAASHDLKEPIRKIVFFTDRLKSRLGLDYTASNTLEIREGKLTGRIEGDIVDAHIDGLPDIRVRIV